MNGSVRLWRREHVAARLQRAWCESICSMMDKMSSSAREKSWKLPCCACVSSMPLPRILVVFRGLADSVLDECFSICVAFEKVGQNGGLGKDNMFVCADLMMARYNLKDGMCDRPRAP